MHQDLAFDDRPPTKAELAFLKKLKATIQAHAPTWNLGDAFSGIRFDDHKLNDIFEGRLVVTWGYCPLAFVYNHAREEKDYPMLMTSIMALINTRILEVLNLTPNERRRLALAADMPNSPDKHTRELRRLMVEAIESA